MGKRKKKTVEINEAIIIEEPKPEIPNRKTVSEKVILEAPVPLEEENVAIIDAENGLESPTPTVEETLDPRYTLLKDSLKSILDSSPSFEKVKSNPWLYLEWRNQVSGLVK